MAPTRFVRRRRRRPTRQIDPPASLDPVRQVAKSDVGAGTRPTSGQALMYGHAPHLRSSMA